MAEKNEQIILSIDLWDTILRRTCHPDEVKLYTAQRMLFLLGPYLSSPSESSAMDLLKIRRDVEREIGNNMKQKGFDDEYEIGQVIDQCISKVAGNNIGTAERFKICHDLINSEIEQEESVSFLDQDLVKMVRGLDYQKIIITSDFYMSERKIAQILKTKRFPFPVDRYFISCDCKLNKRSGRLFKYICQQLNRQPHEFLHIGDNKHADDRMARDQGLRSLPFLGTRGHKLRRAQEQYFKARCTPPYMTEKLFVQTPPRSFSLFSWSYKRKKRLIEYGRYMSPFFVGFALFTQGIACRKQHSSIYFFTREGKFFKKIFDRVLEQNPYNLPHVKSHLLPVSRLATFFPSLSPISCGEMMRIWSMYSTQSMEALFRSLGLDPAHYSDWLKKYDILPGEPIYHPWEDDRVRRFFANRDILDLLTKEQQQRKNLLKEYFATFELEEQKKILTVDIGWRGTIQDNIAHIYPNIHIDGVYIGLQKFFNRQPDNTEKFGYIADCNRHDPLHPVLHHVRPFEMLCNVTGGSASGYKRNVDGTVSPQYQFDENEDQVHEEWIVHFQQGIIDEIENICKKIKRHGISAYELRNLSRKLAALAIEDPQRDICKAYFALKHNETFGNGQFVQPAHEFRLTDKILGYFQPARHRKFMRSLEESCWPQGLLKYRCYGILHALGKIKKRYGEKL